MSAWTEEFEAMKVVHQRLVLPPFLLEVVVGAVIELAKEDVLSMILYADNLVLLNDIIVGLINMFRK